jgi:hypothetical protein
MLLHSISEDPFYQTNLTLIGSSYVLSDRLTMSCDLRRESKDAPDDI